MGGLGSGRRPGFGRALVEDVPSVAIADLYRHGRPVAGLPIVFMSRGDPVVEVAIDAREDEVECRCSFGDGRGRPVRHGFVVRVSWQPVTNLPNGRGVRPVMHCCECDAPCRKLFFRGMSLRCRRCANLAYASQRESPRERSERIRRELGGSPAFLMLFPTFVRPFPTRPPSMDEERYERIRKRAIIREHAIMMHLVEDATTELESSAGRLERMAKSSRRSRADPGSRDAGIRTNPHDRLRTRSK